MGRQRMLRPEHFQDDVLLAAEKKAGLPLRIAYLGLLTQADREGRFKWHPLPLKANIMPWDDGVDFEAVLNALAEVGYVVKYQANGKTYGAFMEWDQKVHPNESSSTIPPPPISPTTVTDSANGASPSSNGASPSSNGMPAQVNSTSEFRSASASASAAKCSAAGEPYSQEFERFWQLYPRKDDKRKAHKAWNTRLAEKVPAEEMVRAARNYADHQRAEKTEEKFIKMPSTFLGPNKPYEEWLTPKVKVSNHAAPAHKAVSHGLRYDPALDPELGGGPG